MTNREAFKLYYREQVYQSIEAVEGLSNEVFLLWMHDNPNALDLEGIIKAAASVKVQGYYTGEDISLSSLLGAGLGGILSGGANTTDDIELGKLIINYDIDYDASKAIAEYEKKLLII
jgi:hypothetical protein